MGLSVSTFLSPVGTGCLDPVFFFFFLDPVFKMVSGSISLVNTYSVVCLGFFSPLDFTY